MRSYAFENEKVVVDGFALSGWGEGDDVLQARRLEDAFTHRVGADGKMLVMGTANKSGEILITVELDSASDAFLNARVLTQEASAFVPVTVSRENVTTGARTIGAKGYIARPADDSLGTNPSAHQYRIVVENYQAFVTGSPEL